LTYKLHHLPPSPAVVPVQLTECFHLSLALKSFISRYLQYKNETARLLRWILDHIQEDGLNPFSGNTAANTNTEQSRTTAGFTHKHRKTKSQATKREEGVLPTNLTTSQMLRVARAIAQNAIARVPKEVIDLVDAVISLRVEHAGFYTVMSAAQSP
jgi:hypothetical protein